MKTTHTNQPAYFRWLFFVAALPLLVVTVHNAYKLINMGTDQNWFASSIGRFYLSRDLSGTEFISASGLPFGEQPAFLYPRQGDLIVRIDDQVLETYADVDIVLSQAMQPGFYTVQVQRPTRRNYLLTFKVPAAMLNRQAVWEIPPTVYVYDVMQGGASSKAGMQIGDLIYQIDGRSFSDGSEANALVLGTLNGQRVTYGIIRKGEYQTLQVTMSRLSIPLGLVLFLFSGFMYMAAAGLLALRRPGLKGARMLSWGFLLVGAGLMLSDHTGAQRSILFPAYVLWPGMLFLFTGLAILIHASYYFPRENPDLLKCRHHRLMSYYLTPFVTAFAMMDPSRYLVIGIGILLIPQIYLRVQQRRLIPREQARLEIYLFWAVIFVVAGNLVWTFGRDGYNRLGDITVRAVSALILFGAYVITLIRFQLLGVSVKRGPMYVVVYIIWLLLVWGAFLLALDMLAFAQWNLLNFSLTNRQIQILDVVTPVMREHNEKLTLMLLTLIAGYLFYRITLLGRAYLRRIFHRTNYDALKATSELTALLSSQVNLQDLSSGLVSSLQRRLLLKRAAVLIFDNEGQVHCHDAGLQDDASWRRLCSEEAPQLANALEGYRTTLRVDYLSVEVKKSLRQMGFRYAQPIRSKNLLVGCLLSGEKLAETAYDTSDFQFLAAAASQAAVAIENAQLYDKLATRERLEHELELARHIQTSSLPQEEPDVSGLDISGTSIPALEVGGDYYAYFADKPEKLTVMVADVSGKGTSAALYMSKMQGIFATLHADALTPRDLFLKANPILYRETERNAFVTAICAQFDTVRRRVRLSRAGHVPMLCYHTNQRLAKEYCPPGLGLGIENRGVFTRVLAEQDLAYQTDDVFLLITDGITEAHDQEFKIFGEDRVLEILKQHAHRDAAAIRGAVMNELADFSFGTEQRDDMTMVVIKITD